MTKVDNGFYYCNIQHTNVPGTVMYSETFVLDVDVTQRRFATQVMDFSGELSTSKGAATEILGLPNSVHDQSFPDAQSRVWAAQGEDNRFIELAFEDPQTVNTAWIYTTNTTIRSISVKNPMSTIYEVVWEGNASNNNSNSIGEREINFPITSFPVDEIFIEFIGSHIDAVSIGTNSFEVNHPERVNLSRVSDQIVDLSWTNIEGENENVEFVVERSVDTDDSFVELATIEFGTDYSDRNLPGGLTSAFYRIKALLNGTESSIYSDTVSFVVCAGSIPTSGTWTGVADLGGGSLVETNPEVVITEVGSGIYEISDYLAFSYIGFNNGLVADVPTRLVDNCGVIEMLPTRIGRDSGYGTEPGLSGTYNSGTETLRLVGEPFFGGTIEFTRNTVDPVPNVPDYLRVSQTGTNQVFVQWRDFVTH